MKAWVLASLLLLALPACADVSATQAAPAPTPTAEQRLEKRLDAELVQGQLESVTYQGGVVTVSIVGIVRSSAQATRDGVLRDTVNILRDVYASGLRLASVAVRVFDDVPDRYGQRHTQLQASAMLLASTAARFNWDYLTDHPALAWSDYDSSYMAV